MHVSFILLPFYPSSKIYEFGIVWHGLAREFRFRCQRGSAAGIALRVCAAVRGSMATVTPCYRPTAFAPSSLDFVRWWCWFRALDRRGVSFPNW